MVHSGLGPGLLESAYEACLEFEMIKAGLYVDRQKPLPLIYKEVRLDTGYRVDFLVESTVIVEVKSIEAIAGIHIAQLLTYLKLSDAKLAYF
jgi:GxxExxY protein